MRYLFLISRKFLFKKKGSTLTACAIVAATIFFIVFNAVVFSGVTEGVVRETSDLRIGHLIITNEDAGPMTNSPNILIRDVQGNSYVQGAAPRVTFTINVEHTTPSGEFLETRVETIGIDPRYERKASLIYNHVVEGTFELRKSGILLGSTLAEKVRAGVGDRVVVKPVSNVEAVERKLHVVGIVKTSDMAGINDAAIVNIKVAREMLLMKDNESTAVIVRLSDPTQTELVKSWIKDRHRDLRVQNVVEAAPWLAGINEGIAFINLVGYAGMITSALGVVIILTLIVTGKTREIGVLRAMGIQRSGILVIFILDGAMIGALGAVAGGIGGALFTIYLENNPVAFFGGLAISAAFSLGTLIMPMITGFFISMLASVYPAWMASRYQPAEAMRYF